VSYQKVVILGNLGQDPDMRYTPSGGAVCSLSVATNEKWLDKKGEKQERVEWHRIVVWGKTGESCGKYLAKGRTVLIEGRLQTRKWDDKEGKTHYTTEIIANEVKFIGSAKEGGSKRSGQFPGSEGNDADPDPFNGAGFDNDDIPF